MLTVSEKPTAFHTQEARGTVKFRDVTSRTTDNPIVWIDCEMTGLDLSVDELVEVSVVITDADLNPYDAGIDVLINPSDKAVAHMSDFVRNMHTKSGLIEEWGDGLPLKEAEAQVLAYIKERVPEAGKAQLGGNSVGTDKAFLDRHMPSVIEHLHYRIIDVSSIKELAKRWYPRVYFSAPEKTGNHRALGDIYDSIDELRYYRSVLFPDGKGPGMSEAEAVAKSVAGQTVQLAEKLEVERQKQERAATKMRQAGMSDYEVNSFIRTFERFTAGETALIPETDIEAVDDVEKDSSLSEVSREVLAHTAVLKLNGGIGTTMGLTCPKSVLEAHDGQNFLEITARQILAARKRLGVNLPFILLNSPSTHESTMQALSAFDLEVDGLPLAVIQGVFPRIEASTFEPIEWADNPELEWAPPGHGDLYGVLDRTGVLDQLIDKGYEYLFVSNIDNTGAVLSEEIATWFATSGAPFAAEVARRSPMDMKGGHFARRSADGQIILREIAQCPEDDEKFFRNIELHKYMNTNNLWIHLASLREKLDSKNFDLALIVNRKRIDQKDSASPEIIQLESAMGSAISLFEGARILEVGRERFVPVKSTADLLLLRSDVFALDEENRLVQQTDCRPTVKLDEAFFKRYDQFEERVKAVPSLRHARSLTVTGDVTLPEDYVAEGDALLS